MTTALEQSKSTSPPSDWPESWHRLTLPDYQFKDLRTGKEYASVVFKSCAIDETGVHEILLVNRQQCNNPLMILEIPIEMWHSRECLGHLGRCLPWQDDTRKLVHLDPCVLGGPRYTQNLQICYGEAILARTPIFRPGEQTQAKHILVKSSWEIPSTLATFAKTAYEYETAAGRFEDSFIDATMEYHHALVYRRAASNFYRYGADYWIFSLGKV